MNVLSLPFPTIPTFSILTLDNGENIDLKLLGKYTNSVLDQIYRARVFSNRYFHHFQGLNLETFVSLETGDWGRSYKDV